MYAWLWGRETVLPGCVWSRPRPEELKALNVIIRVVGEPSSNHTQITYTLTPTYNTSHSRVVCVCVSKKKRQTEIERGKEKRNIRSICSTYASSVTVKSVCSDKHVVSEWRLGMRVLEKRVYFSLLFLPPSLHVSLLSHPSIFHFYMQLQMWRQWNIKL